MEIRHLRKIKHANQLFFVTTRQTNTWHNQFNKIVVKYCFVSKFFIVQLDLHRETVGKGFCC